MQIARFKKELLTASGKERFDLLNDLAWEYRFAYPDSTIYYSDRAYDLGKMLNLPTGLARPVNFMGIAYNYKGDRIPAFEHYRDALEIATRQMDTLQIAHSNNNIGRLFYDQGLLARSYDYLVKSITFFRSINDSSGIAYSLQSLGNLYKTQRDYRKAEENLLKAYAIRLDEGDPRAIMSAMVYLGRMYLENNQLEESIHFFRKADSTGHVIDDEINLAEIKTYLAESLLKKGMIREAESICMEGLRVIQNKNNLRLLPQAYQTLGQILMEKGDLAKARVYLEQSLQIAERIKDLNSKMESHFLLVELFKRTRNERERIYNQNQYLILKDSIKDLDLARQVERLQFEVEIERKERDFQVLKANNEKNSAIIEQQRLQNIILVILFAFASILGILFWKSYTKSSAANRKLTVQKNEIEVQRTEILKQNEQLSQRNHQLSELNHEKDTLMGIVAHDLKSPLNRIEGITYLMEMDGKLNKEQQEYTGMIKAATRAGLLLITDLLDVHMLEENPEPAFTRFDISRFLLDKTESFRPEAEAKEIHLHISRVENEEVYTDYDYLNRIVDNLISNAIKFSPRNSVIEIAADRTEFEFWISVRDTGPGFSPADKAELFKKFKKLSARPTAGETSNGLGLAIVKTLVDRMNGHIELTSEPGKGSQFTVRFPQERQYA